MTPIEDYTVENWLKGQIETYEVDMLYYTEYLETKDITEEQHKKSKIEFEKIHNLQKEAFDAVVDNHLESYKHHFELDVKRAKNKERYIELEKNKVKEWLEKHPELQQRIMINRPDVSYFTFDRYKEYLKEKEYWNPKKDYKYYPADKNIQASLYTKYLDYLGELDPKAGELNQKKVLTLLDFYTKDEESYHKDMEALTEPFFIDEQEQTPILKRNGNDYELNPLTGYQKYLGAHLLSMVKIGRLKLEGKTKMNREVLKEIIMNTFNCKNFNKNTCSAIRKQNEDYFINYIID